MITHNFGKPLRKYDKYTQVIVQSAVGCVSLDKDYTFKLPADKLGKILKYLRGLEEGKG